MALDHIHSRFSSDIEAVASQIVDSAYKVHNYFGPGLNERIYEEAFCRALTKKDIFFHQQKPVRVFFEEEDLGLDYKLDLLVDNKIVIEIKAVNELLPLHKAQLISYMKLTQKSLGFLINFNTVNIGHGIKRLAL